MLADEDSEYAEYLSQSLLFWRKMKTKLSLELHPTDSLEKRLLICLLPPASHTHIY